MSIVNPLLACIEQLTKLPGIGPKSAQRLAFFLLSLPQKEVEDFCKIILETRKNIKYCQVCFNIGLEDKCFICADEKRDKSTLCLVAEPKDIFALERTQEYQGLYHVLGGLLSPLDGFHPEVLRIQELLMRLKNENIKEIIFAINPTIEGDATVLYLNSLLKDFNVKLTRLAYGLPMGSDLDYADEITLKKSLQARAAL